MTSNESNADKLIALTDALTDYYRNALAKAENRVRKLEDVRWAAELLYVICANRDGGEWIGKQPEYVRDALYRLSDVLKADTDYDNGDGR